MSNVEKSNNEVEKKYEELILELKKKLPNIILPSMGMLDEVDKIDIDGKEYIINDSYKEE